MEMDAFLVLEAGTPLMYSLTPSRRQGSLISEAGFHFSYKIKDKSNY